MKVKWKGETNYLILTHDKVYEVISIEKGWYRIVEDSGEDYLYPPEFFEIIEKKWYLMPKNLGGLLMETERTGECYDI